MRIVTKEERVNLYSIYEGLKGRDYEVQDILGRYYFWLIENEFHEMIAKKQAIIMKKYHLCATKDGKDSPLLIENVNEMQRVFNADEEYIQVLAENVGKTRVTTAKKYYIEFVKECYPERNIVQVDCVEEVLKNYFDWLKQDGFQENIAKQHIEIMQKYHLCSVGEKKESPLLIKDIDEMKSRFKADDMHVPTLIIDANVSRSRIINAKKYFIEFMKNKMKEQKQK